MATIMFLYPSMVLLVTHHQVLCYYSLAKPDPRTKSKSLVSQDYSYRIVIPDKNVMAEITAWSQSCRKPLASGYKQAYTRSNATPYQFPEELGLWWHILCEWTQVRRSKVRSSTTTRHTCRENTKNNLTTRGALPWLRKQHFGHAFIIHSAPVNAFLRSWGATQQVDNYTSDNYRSL